MNCTSFKLIDIHFKQTVMVLSRLQSLEGNIPFCEPMAFQIQVNFLIFQACWNYFKYTRLSLTTVIHILCSLLLYFVDQTKCFLSLCFLLLCLIIICSKLMIQVEVFLLIFHFIPCINPLNTSGPVLGP